MQGHGARARNIVPNIKRNHSGIGRDLKSRRENRKKQKRISLLFFNFLNKIQLYFNY
jgi:hypothetical protein